MRREPRHQIGRRDAPRSAGLHEPVIPVLRRAVVRAELRVLPVEEGIEPQRFTAEAAFGAAEEAFMAEAVVGGAEAEAAAADVARTSG